MTNISPAVLHRPPTYPPSTTSLRPPKRLSVADDGENTDERGRIFAEEWSAPKRQKVESPGSAAVLPIPLSSDVLLPAPAERKFFRTLDTQKLPVELIDGFFVGSEGVGLPLLNPPGAARPSPPSLPYRPWKHSLLIRNAAEGRLNNTGVRRRDDMQVQNVPYKTVPPRDCPRAKQEGTADSAPWVGSHLEDVLGDQSVKHGFTDRISHSQNETNTARQSLYSLFKHRPGLQTLSSLFAAVVEERETFSKIPAGSAFKPPPRVTLTEAKRKSWLSDLANPGVPLRKLSRTIPQGIRGQSLFDQCFANNVPVGRALWFAKCVGANEIRTLKRKGTNAASASGVEIKWLRDWTVNLEHFIEGNIHQLGQADWRTKQNYSLSLAVRLYSESLLDRDHYLDWIVNSISAVSWDWLPVWLLMANLHRVDLTHHHKRGRSLVKNLLERLYTSSGPCESPLASLTSKLKQLLRWILHASPSCFLIPQSWSNHKDNILASLDSHSEIDVLLFGHLSFRNERLSARSDTDSSESQIPRQAILDILDSAEAPFNYSSIAQECLSACRTKVLVVNVVLEWSSSRFRAGLYRVYLAAHLLAMWKDDFDTHPIVVQFLASQQESDTSADHRCLSLLVAELVRSEAFSFSRYLQWLTARGGLLQNSCRWPSATASSREGPAQNEILHRPGFDAAQVLLAAPPSSLKPVVRNLRDIMLSRAGCSDHQQPDLVRTCIHDLTLILPRLFETPANEISDVSGHLPSFSHLSGYVKSEIAQVLRKRIRLCTSWAIASTRGIDAESVPVAMLGDKEFRLLRRICEELDELRLLAATIEFCITSNDDSLLSSIADTVNFHCDAFSALGIFAALHLGLFQRFLTICSTECLPRSFIVSLISLGSVVPSEVISVSSLQQYLARGDGNNAMAACSPVSDGMAESLQQAGSTFTEEFEAVLCTGSRMEAQTMTQLFNVLADRLQKGQHQTEAENDDILCTLNARLRVYRIVQFDALMAAWLEKLVITENARLKDLLPMLISSSCLSFGACVDLFIKAQLTSQADGPKASPLQIHLTNFVNAILAAEKSIDPIFYKLRNENARYIKMYPDRAMTLWTGSGYVGSECKMKLPQDLLIAFVLKGQAADKVQPSFPMEIVTAVLDHLLQLPANEDDPFIPAFPQLVKQKTDFSMPFCHLRLQLWAATSPTALRSAGQEAIVRTLFDLAISDADESWMSYLSAIGGEVAGQLREKAEESFLALPLFPNPGRCTSVSSPAAPSFARASTYVRIASQTAYSIPPTGIPALIPALIEKLAGVLKALLAGKLAARKSDITGKPRDVSNCSGDEPTVDLDYLSSYLHLLLQMTSIHRAAFAPRPEPPPSAVPLPKQLQQESVRILVLLINIAMHPLLKGCAGLSHHSFDLAAIILDEVSEDIRSLCARFLKDKMRDERVECLFGGANSTKGSMAAFEASATVWATDRLQVEKDGKRVGEYRIRNWEMLEGATDASVSLSLFDARREA